MTGRLSVAKVTVAITLASAALALWVSFGALSFVDVDADGAYVGVLPPLRWLVILLVATGGVALAVRPSLDAVAPLWLSAVLLLPWLPFPLPRSVFIWTGNVPIWLWAAIAVALAIEIGARRSIGRKLDLLRKPDPTRHAVFAGIAAAVAFGLGTWSTAPHHPEGDEPHYLVITQSLLNDRDLKIENNHTQGDYRAYLNRSIKPDFLQRGKDGQIYSIHAPGLPLLVAPGFAVAGYPGVLVELVLLGAVASALVWRVAWQVTGEAAASWFAWAAVTLSVPFFFHASAVFPDGLGAVLTLVAVLPLVEARAREPRYLVAIGAALAALPWLHSRFAILAASAAVVIAGRAVTEPSRRVARLAAFAAWPALSAAGWFLFFQVIYGTPNPAVTYGGTTSTAAGNIVRGAPGLLFDQQFGLIPNAPVYLCAAAGIFLMLSGRMVRHRADTTHDGRRLALELLIMTLPYFLVVTFFFMWWAGTTPPARFLVPITLVLAIPTAICFAAAKRTAARTVSLAALMLSVLMTITIASVERGAFVFNFRDGMSRVALWLTPVVDLTRALPSLFQNPPSIVLLQTVVWLAAIASAVGVAAAVGRRGRTAVILGLGLTLEMAAMAAVALVWRTNRSVVATPYAAGPALLRRYDAEANQVALAYRPFQRVRPADLPRRVVLARAMTMNPEAQPVSVRRLPAGIYEVTGNTVGTPAGRLQLTTDRLSAPIAEWEVSSLGSEWRRQTAVPVGVAALFIEADAAARGVVRNVSMRALSVSKPQTGLDHLQATAAARYGSVLLFLVGGDAWVEPAGSWVAGDSDAEFAIAPDGPAPVHLSFRSGPVANHVTLESGTWRERLALTPGEERVLQLPIDGKSGATLLKVGTTGGFRPVEFDSNTEDERFLGVRIEIR